MPILHETSTARKVRDLLIALALLSPIPLGGYSAWISASYSLIVLVAVAVLVAAGLRTEVTWPPMRGSIRIAIVLYSVVLGWSVVQAVPLPLSIDGLAADIFGKVGAISDIPMLPSISIDRMATLGGVVTAAAYGAFLWCIASLVRQERAFHAYVSLCTVSLVIGIVAVAFDLAGIQKVLWIEKWIYHDVATGTFLHRNAYADYAGLGIIAAAVVYLSASGTGRRPAWMIALCGTSVAINALGLLLSESRAGIVCTAVAVVPLAIKWAIISKVRLSSLIFSALALFTAALATAFMMVPRLLDRLRIDALLDDNRWAVYRLAWRALTEAPLTGHGLSTFPSVYFQFLDADLYGSYFRRAHSTYLELAVDIGIPMALALMIAGAIVVVAAARGWRKPGREGVYATGALSAGLLLGLHNLADFTLYVPAIMLTALLMVGIGLSRRFA
jgi:O-antigen ligase